MVIPPPRDAPPLDSVQREDALALLTRLAPGSVDLVYADPPFSTGKRRPGLRGRAGFDDRWPDLSAYVTWLVERLAAARAALRPSGSLVVHLDWHAVHYVKVALDGVFGYDHFLNEIVWSYGLGGSSSRYWPRKHDTLLWYARRAGAHWFEADRIPATSRRLAGHTKKAPDVWAIPALNNMARERTGYPTQKPLALLERIVRSTCPPGGVVVDPFCGSGTTLVAAATLGRRFVGADIASDAVALARDRLAAADVP